MEPQVFRDISLDELTREVQEYQQRGWRFVNICGSTVGVEVELLFSFSNQEELENLRMLVPAGVAVPAVSPYYPNAFFFENETRDLYGVRFEGTTIDFDGRFYPASVPTPMNPASAQAREAYGVKEVSCG